MTLKEIAVAEREHWGSRIGLILAAAGNAIGIGNLLRFPGQAATNGGGAFMIPYVVCFLLLGLPMMWVAWAVGRFGGRYGHGTTPGMFDRMVRRPSAKYLGVLGVALPICFCLYYTYIESWCLGYSFFSLTGDYVSARGRHVDLTAYFGEFQGSAPTQDYFPGLTPALVFLVITLGLNIFVLWRGIAQGIELLAKIAVPLLFLFCVVLAVRIFTVTPPPQGSPALEGLSFLWTPVFAKLWSGHVWMAAAGQIFFTLSIGFGSLECYASYLRDQDDIALTGLSTASTNEFVEVIFGSLIAIPAAAVFFGSEQIETVAEEGTFAIGMISMPEVLRSFPGVQFFGTIWFLLLFFAAFTSSVAVCQPVMAFFEDEARLRRGTAAMVVGIIWLLGTLPVIYFNKYGAVDEMDFWAGQIGLVVFSLIEVVLFAWVFGIDRGWEELHRGADLRVPRPFYYVTKYATPVLLAAIFAGWFVEAIGQDKLIPSPRLTWGVLGQSRLPGTFLSGAGADVRAVEAYAASKRRRPAELTEADFTDFTQSPEGRDWTAERWRQATADAAARSSFEDAARRLAAEERRDLKAWAAVELGADGPAVTALEGDPVLRREIEPGAVGRWLRAIGFHYRPAAAEAGPQRVEIVMEVLHTAPYIWLTRLILVAFTGTFAGAVAVIWRSREESAGKGAEA